MKLFRSLLIFIFFVVHFQDMVFGSSSSRTDNTLSSSSSTIDNAPSSSLSFSDTDPLSSPELPVKLGTYDYQTQESTPIIYNGQLLMFESMIPNDPEWIPVTPNCTQTYFRIRNQYTGQVVVNISSSCGAAFGAALVQTNDAGLETLFIYGTSGRFVGPCWTNNGTDCRIDAFYSSDPNLVDSSWTYVLGVVMPAQMVANQDVAHVGVPESRSYTALTNLPPHEWIMILENDNIYQFLISNVSDPTDSNGWIGLPINEYFVDQLSGWQVGACPSIRFDPSTGYYYILTGGYEIFLLRSQTLLKGSWELANVPRGAIISPDRNDCVVMGPPYGAWYKPSTLAQQYLDNCTQGIAPFNTSYGFGNDSDADLTEVIITTVECQGFASSGILSKSPSMNALCTNITQTGQPQIATLFQYGSGDQKSFGFSNLAIAPGTMFNYLSSFF